MRNAGREVIAGIVGFLVFTTLTTLLFYLSGYDPHAAVSRPFQVISVIAGILFALLSGYVTASISRLSPMRPAVMVASLIAVFAILSMIVSGSGEAWSQLSTLVLMVPSIVLGARLRRDRGARGEDSSEQGTNL